MTSKRLDAAINNVKIVTPERIYSGNVGITGEKISVIDENTTLDANIIINGEGNYLFPGLVDNHVHLNEPGYTWREDFIHGTKAAAIGGVTTVVDMPMQNTPAVSNTETANKKAKLLNPKSHIDYSFWGALVDYNLNELIKMAEWGMKGFKSFLSPVSDDYTSLKYGKVREALGILQSIGAFAGFHCEDYDIIRYEEQKAIQENRNSIQDYLRARPVISEVIATQTILDLAEEQDAKVHICHVSHSQVVHRIKEAKDNGVKVTGETCPHYLVFSEEDVIKGGLSFKCSPPIREKSNVDGLWKAVEEGTLDCIVSDHSPSSIDEKDERLGAFEAWGGISGLQTRLQVVFNEGVHNRGLSPTFIARMMAQKPAEIFGLTRKGKIQEGYDADFVLLDQDKEWVIKEEELAYQNKFSAFCGMKGKGLPIMTMLRGKIIAENGKVLSESGYGQLMKV